jgi:hypothetical protein
MRSKYFLTLGISSDRFFLFPSVDILKTVNYGLRIDLFKKIYVRADELPLAVITLSIYHGYFLE